MRIGVDAGCLGIANQGQKQGIYRMASELVTALSQIDKSNEYILYSFLPLEDKFLKLSTKFTNKVVRPSWGWNTLALPRHLRRDKVDLFLGLSQALPRFFAGRKIVIVHDLGFEYWPQYYPQWRYLRHLTQMAIKRADVIVAVSRTTKKDMEQIYQVPAKKIKVVYEGVNHRIFKPSEKKVKKYFLFVGGSRPSKNLGNTMRAFEIFRQRVRGYKLIRVMKEMGDVGDKKLIKLYQEATAVVIPSYYEGFGLPIVEAQACGRPVIAGKYGAAREVGGKSVFLVEPEKPEEIARAMGKIANSEQLIVNSIGIRNAKKYTWEKMARGIIKIVSSK